MQGADRSTERRSDRNSIQVIARAAEVLRLLAEHDALSLAEIARHTDLPRSTIQRIVNALRDEEFVAATPRGAGFALGPGLSRLVESGNTQVRALLYPLIEQLAREVDETVDLSVLNGRQALFLEHIAGAHRLAAVSAVGTEFPLHSTANGKAMLACFLPERWRSLLVLPLSANTSRTRTDPAELVIELQAVARTGLAFDLEEHTEGVCAIGAAFLDPVGRPYALSIPVPRLRFDVKREALQEPLLRYRALLADRIRGSLPRRT